MKTNLEYPYKRTMELMEGSPNSSYLDFYMSENPIAWEYLSYNGVIKEVEYCIEKFTCEGWEAYESIQNGCKETMQELKELRQVLKFIKNKVKTIATDCNCCDSRCMGGIDCKNADVDGFDIPSCV